MSHGTEWHGRAAAERARAWGQARAYERRALGPGSTARSRWAWLYRVVRLARWRDPRKMLDPNLFAARSPYRVACGACRYRDGAGGDRDPLRDPLLWAHRSHERRQAEARSERAWARWEAEQDARDEHNQELRLLAGRRHG